MIFMSIPIVGRCYLVILVAILSGCRSDSYALDDSRAKEIIEREWSKEFLVFQLGVVEFVTERPNPSAKREAYANLPYYRAFAQHGLLSLKNERDLTSKFSGWSDFLSLTQSGVQYLATVEATDAGRKVAFSDSANDQSAIKFKTDKYRVEKIVSNDTIDVMPDRYRLLQGLHSVDIDAAFFHAVKQIGELTVRERRFRCLLKYDPFTEGWTVVIYDVAERSKEFSTNNVPETIGRLTMRR